MEDPSKPITPIEPKLIANGPSELSVGKTNVLEIDYKVAALLSYIPFCAIHLIFSILWVVTEPKQSRFVRFYALQSLVLSGAIAALAVIVWGMSMILIMAPFLRFFLVQLPWFLFSATFLVINILCMINAYRGIIFRVPFAADIADKYLER